MQGSINFKFGVVYAKDNQMSDEEFYSNSTSYGLNWDHVGQVGLFLLTATHQQFFWWRQFLFWSKQRTDMEGN